MKKSLGAAIALMTALSLAGCAPAATESTESASETASSEPLVVYAGRSEELVQPLIDQFTEATGIEVEVRYAGSAELAAQILEEGANSPADVFFAQDAGALGAVSKAGLLKTLDQSLRDLVSPEYGAKDGSWIGVSGRVRVLNYNPERVTELPKSVFDLANPEYQGRVGIAPTNASFQAFVTAMRLIEGEAKTLQWLEAMKVNGVVYEKNGAILDAVEAGEIDLGLINHYYWYAKAKEVGVENLKSKIAQFESQDVGNLRNVAGVGILSENPNAKVFVEYLLSQQGQQYFVEQTGEYPLVAGIELLEGLVPLSDIPAPEFDLNDLDALEQTLELIRQAGLI
ncbi:iron ABC transporter substrate-binding protein [Aquiluna sp. KACHI24]|uniref:iron ABC transporter substrate-binding protein n=1 Tax=Aquiluna sp. KACHI24 TaxID=2968831 RepID=UPI00220DED3C|nr:iron ABC transporter substrate-binding protein [Aquiluna sp. KACHI24]BDP99780.1 iron ABC transporter substrate-binding protein [Aquiluna sp. KACHI24]